MFDFVTEDSMRLCLRPSDNYITPLKNGNVVVACFVTSYARLCFHEKLHELKHRVLYYDMDSIINSTKEGEEKLKCGNFLGPIVPYCPG